MEDSEYRERIEALKASDFRYEIFTDKELIEEIKNQEKPKKAESKPEIETFQSISEIEKLKQFYRTLGISDFSSWNNLKLPNKREGFDRLIIVHKDLTNDQLFEKCKERFNAWKYASGPLDSVVTQNDRTNKDRTYAIWVRPCIEADEIHKNKSANNLAQQNIKGITLKERLAQELIYHAETNDHLDKQNFTLCSGSRVVGGRVPCVLWYVSELYVYWFFPGRQGGVLRSREVVSD